MNVTVAKRVFVMLGVTDNVLVTVEVCEAITVSLAVVVRVGVKVEDAAGRVCVAVCVELGSIA